MRAPPSEALPLRASIIYSANEGLARATYNHPFVRREPAVIRSAGLDQFPSSYCRVAQPRARRKLIPAFWLRSMTVSDRHVISAISPGLELLGSVSHRPAVKTTNGHQCLDAKMQHPVTANTFTKAGVIWVISGALETPRRLRDLERRRIELAHCPNASAVAPPERSVWNHSRIHPVAS